VVREARTTSRMPSVFFREGSIVRAKLRRLVDLEDPDLALLDLYRYIR
jgi:hypothetical protein